MVFTAQITTERTQAGQRQSVQQQEYMCHVFVREDGLAAVLFSDQDYPRRVAFTMLSKVCKVVQRIGYFLFGIPFNFIPLDSLYLADTYTCRAHTIERVQCPVRP